MKAERIEKGIVSVGGNLIRFTRYYTDDVARDAEQLIQDGIPFKVLSDHCIEVYEKPSRRTKKIGVFLIDEQIDWLKAYGDISAKLRELIDRSLSFDDSLEDVASDLGCESVIDFFRFLVHGEILVLFHPYDEEEELRSAAQEIRQFQASGRLKNLLNGVANALEKAANRINRL
ncbi:MAG: hypothetical protein QXS54_08715 [Candidatus Methanomethylicaceae archaeon]